ncbi:hypothetical protein ACFFIS_14675 [Virgibacillus soli]|uniref:ABC transporter permease n=1 Tax=Paracerasibacillus soli TaxID=480284 RepID=A0ABU5CV92_9BACI|nr:hypothetical protein [Virgibacillus soli]MDY0410297.1 hypothetical protein [Virgibacillus soli]
MSLTTVNFFEVVKKQYVFKMKSYRSLFTSLIITQLIGILFSMGGGGSMGIGGGDFYVNISFLSADIVIAFTMLAVFTYGIQLTTKAYRYDDFTFVTNRMSACIANIFFLLSMSVFGAITAILSGNLIKVIAYFMEDSVVDIRSSITIMQYVFGVVSTILLIFLFSTFGYFIGAMVQRHKLFMFVIPTVIIGVIVFFSKWEIQLVVEFGKFFFQETLFSLFVLKVGVTSLLLFAVSFWAMNRLEVRE